MQIKAYILLTGIILMISSCGENNKTETSSKPTSTGDLKENEAQSTEIIDADFGALLTELESNIGWSAVTDQWKDRRDAWVADCFSKTEISDKASLLMEFESYLKWEAVDQRWADRREAWIYDLENSTNDKDLGAYLAELEEYILWDVVSPNWVNVRESWVQNCTSLGEGQW